MDYYLAALSTRCNGDRCCPCRSLRGVSCGFNTTEATLNLDDQEWRHSELTIETHSCLVRDGWSPCIGGSSAGQDGDGYCQPGHGGPRCEVCIDSDTYFKVLDARCYDCGEAWKNLGWTALAVVATALLVALLLKVGFHRGLVQRVWWRVRSLWRKIGLSAKLKQLVTNAQVLSAVPSTYMVSLPDGKYASWVDALEVPNLITAEIFTPPECLDGGYFSMLLFSSFWPWALALLAVLAMTALQAYRAGCCVSCDPAEGGGRLAFVRSVLSKGLFASLPFVLTLTFLVVTSASSRILKTFLCDPFAYDDGESESRSYLHDDYGLNCASGEYKRAENWALGLAFLWPFGIPLLYGFLLFKSRKAILSHEANQMSAAIKFLWAEYQPAYFWWEPLELLRKLTLTGFVLFIDEKYVLGRSLAALLMSLAFCAAHDLIQPYRTYADNLLAKISHYAVTLVFLAVLMLKVCNESEAVCETFGTGSTGDSIFLIFLVVSTLLLCGMLILATTRLVYEYNTETGMLVFRVGGVPDLSLPRNFLWHLFLSHIWGSGQDQVAVIKRQLQLCLPGIRVFLDVDDLKDISALETYISQTTVSLIFLSDGYFRSRNCLREAYASLEKSKPLVLVHEADTSKGGLSLEDVQAQCPDDLSEYVFGAAAPQPITWHRVAEYQRLCLKLVAGQVLRFCPAVKQKQLDVADGEESSLSFAGESSRKGPIIDRPINLVVSVHNPGALRFAEEVAVSLKGVLAQSRCTSLKVAVTQLEETGADLLRALATLGADASFLLYLNMDTFCGDDGGLLASQVRKILHAPGDKVNLFLAHENDRDLGGCEFGRFFSTTPNDLIKSGIYSQIAIAFHANPFRRVSLSIAAHKLSESGEKKSDGCAAQSIEKVARAIRAIAAVLGGFSRVGCARRFKMKDQIVSSTLPKEAVHESAAVEEEPQIQMKV